MLINMNALKRLIIDLEIQNLNSFELLQVYEAQDATKLHFGSFGLAEGFESMNFCKRRMSATAGE